MSCACDVIDDLYFNRDCDDEEIIDIAMDMIKECLNHMKENCNEEDIKEQKIKIHNELLVICEDYEYV